MGRRAGDTVGLMEIKSKGRMSRGKQILWVEDIGGK